MSLQNRLTDLATRAATEAKALRTLINGNAADLASLTTTNKASLVAALNELKTAVDAAAGSGGAIINDAAQNTTEAWSGSKVADSITAAVNALIGGAPGALDTLNELAAALNDDANFTATVTTELGKRVRVDTAAQGLDATQKSNARTNIGAVGTAEIGDPETDFVATFNTGLL
jgi:hypothetical protein